MKKFTFLLSVLVIISQAHAQTELISNGDFNSCDGWEISGEFTYDCSGFYSHYNFTYGYAYNLQVDNASGGIAQNFSFPENVSEATLKFYHKIATEETNNAVAYDKLTVLLISDSQAYEVDELSNVDNSSTYIEKSYSIPPDLFNDEDVNLLFIVDNDGAKPTRFRIDDISLVVETNNNGGNGFNIAVDNVVVSDTNPDVGQVISLSCEHIVEGNCGCAENFDPRPDVAFGWSFSSIYDSSSFNLIGTQNSTIGIDLGDPEDLYWTVPNSLEGQTIYIHFIPDYNDEYQENLEGDYSTITVNVNSSGQNTEGNITINLSPAEATSDGAQWKTTSSSSWLNSGETLTLPFGTYTIEFREIDSWNEPANQSITISESSPNYSDQFAYTEINSNSGSISGTLINLEMNSDFQMINGSLNDFVIKLFENGSGTPIQQTSTGNGTFVFSNLEDGMYQIVAQSISNGTVEFETQKSVEITNSNSQSIIINSSKGLINKIENYNAQLSNLSCYWNYTGQNYEVNTNSTNNSYDVNVSASYILNNTFIVDNDTEVIDKLSRFAILSKATLEYYELGCELTSEFLESFKDGTSASFDLLEGLFCSPGDVEGVIGGYIFNAIRNTTIYLIEDQEYANELNLTSALNGLFDTIELYLLGSYPSVTTYAQLLTINGLDDTLINRFLVNGYINKTAYQFNASINQIFNNNLNSDIASLGNDTKNALLLIETGTVDVTIATATAYRDSGAWVEFIDLLNDTFGGCDPLSATWNLGSNLVEIASVTNSIFHLNFGRQELYNNVNINLSDITFQRNSALSNNCTEDYIADLVSAYNIKINEYNSKLNLISEDIENTSSQDITDILNIHNELDYLEEILRSMFLKIQINSNLDAVPYFEDYQNSSYTVPINRLAMTMMIAKYSETADYHFKNEILNHKTQTLDSNNSGYLSWVNLYNSLSSFCAPIDLIVTKREIPRRVEINSDSDLEIEITNTGSLPANNVGIQVISNGAIIFDQENFDFASIEPASSINVVIPFNAGDEINISNCEIIVTSDDTIEAFSISGNIATVESLSLSNDEFEFNNNDIKIYPNPTSNELNIKNESGFRIEIIRVYNLSGGIVFQSYQSLKPIEMGHLSVGMYIIEFNLENGNKVKSKFLKM